MSMQIHESAEDYLEQILMLREKNGYVRSIDIANSLGYSKPSISIAMKHLRENGYIEMDKENLISLTDAGLEIAERVYKRHKTLRTMLMNLGVSAENAEKDACKIEHDISEETFEKITAFVEKMTPSK